jgi:hypothetical protein
MNAFVGPKVRDYIALLSRRLRDAGIGGELQVMGSNGGAATVRMVQDRPVLTMLSGPAAGVLGGTWAGALSRRDNLITFDMGRNLGRYRYRHRRPVHRGDRAGHLDRRLSDPGADDRHPHDRGGWRFHCPTG